MALGSSPGGGEVVTSGLSLGEVVTLGLSLGEVMTSGLLSGGVMTSGLSSGEVVTSGLSLRGPSKSCWRDERVAASPDLYNA